MLRFLILLLTLDAVLIAAWALWRLSNGAAPFTVAEVTPPLVAAGVLVALLTLLFNRQRTQSEDYLEHAQDLLEKAYSRLAVPDEKGRPQNKRLNWLTSARLIRTAQAVAKKIEEPSHREIWNEQINYWRGRFYDMIFPGKEGFSSDYYAEKPEHMFVYSGDERSPLSLKSLAVLYRFIRWPEGQEDPIRGEPPFTEEEIQKMLAFGPRGLGELLEKVDSIAKAGKKPAA
jgi:hypothetical protein